MLKGLLPEGQGQNLAPTVLQGLLEIKDTHRPRVLK